MFKLVIDTQHFDWQQPTITGTQIKQLVGVDPAYGVWQEIPGPNDPPIGDNQVVPLNEHGENRFFTGKKTTTEG